MKYDFVIIGSGFGGSVSACRLAAAGRSVLVLERGRRWGVNEFPRDSTDAWMFDPDQPHIHNGWIDLRMMDQMFVVQGAAVGGGSLIYANVSIDAKPEQFESFWPPEITHAGLMPYYEIVGDMLGVNPIPKKQVTRRYQLTREAAKAIGDGKRFRSVDLAVTFDPKAKIDPDNLPDPDSIKLKPNRFGKLQGTCMHCGNCDIGCDVLARNTLDLNYLADAENNGATVAPLSMVSRLSPIDGGYRIFYDKLSGGSREPHEVDATNVILAAGSLGSTEILLRCRDQYRTLPNLSAALGHGWSSNGDFLTPAFYSNRKISPTIGPTITCAIDYLDREEGRRVFVEDGGFPNVFANFLSASSNYPHLSVGKRFLRMLVEGFEKRDMAQDLMPWFGQGVDAADGQLYLGRKWYAPWRRSLRLNWDVSRSQATIQALIDKHQELAAATGGNPIVPPTWTLLKTLFTPHPLGGCGMSASPAGGVVDHRGQVFGYEGLHVSDGSIIPRALGINPSKTIAALAERNIEMILAD